MKRLLSLPKSLLLALLRSPQITVAVGVLMLAALIWFAGPLVGLSGGEIRLALIVALLFIWIFFLLFDRIRADRGAQALEQSLQKQALDQKMSARPDRKGEIEALGLQFDKAIASLKQSKLGKNRRRSAALYALPWYMFIGPPASGKSTALLHSGLQFPSLGASGKGVQGVGGTRNCDWWFTNEAVLLDTAGRYVTEDDDREEWFGFLDLLKRHRKRKPINGVLAAVSVADLFEANEEELEYHAKNIRNRIDELIQRLGIVFPVYLILTKCDLLRGFTEFFEDLNKSERDQIWGATFPRSPLSKASARGLFDSEFQNLFAALHARRMTRLASARGSRKIKEVFGFPLQLASGREKLGRFVELLFQSNPYQENPIFRGFYLTSGTQEGTPIDRILGVVSRATGLPDVVSDVFEEEKESKSYFIKDLFTEIIFPDQILAGQTSMVERQRGYMRIAAFIGALLFLTVAFVGLSFSFVGNKRLHGAVVSSSLKAIQMNTQDDRQFVKNVQLLDPLRLRLDQLHQYEEGGPPLRLRGGLYRGGLLYEPLKRLYFERFNAIFLAPTRSAIEMELQGFVSNPNRLPDNRDSDYYYSLLKAYLMMADPSRKDPAFLEERLQKIWRDFLAAYYGEKNTPKGLPEMVARHISFYARATGGTAPFAAEGALVKEAQRILREVPFTERLYARVRRRGSEGREPYTLQAALHGKQQDVLTNDDAIPGFFTEEGRRGAFKEITAKVLDESQKEGWVLGLPDANRAELEAGIEKLYFEEYVRQWQKFLESTRVRPADSLAQAVKELDALAGDDSPLTALLREAARNTRLEEEGPSVIGVASGVASGLVEKMKRGLRLGQGEEAPSPPLASGPVSSHFKSLYPFLARTEKKEAPVAQYRAELAKVSDGIRGIVQSGGGESKSFARAMATGGGNESLQAVRNVEKMVQQFDPESRQVLGPLLLQPFKITISGVMNSAQADLNQRWRTEVYETCVQSIAGRYPFRRDGDDATLADVAEFFQPENGTLWKFYQKELKPFVEEGRDRWEAKKVGAGGMNLSPEFLENLRRASLISESLFPRGAADPKFSFDLYPYPAPGVSEILFQVDGKDFRYRNEPQEWHEFAWPGPSAAQGVSLQANIGGARQVRRYTGRWALFKLLDSGRVTPVGGGAKYQLEWDLSLPNSKVVKIRYDLKAESYKNPFRRGFFTDFRCAPKIG